MTCRDLMTPNPSCCAPGDSVATAAQIMKTEDVGAIPVVSDYNSRTLFGIVTDRDLAMKVVAEGRNSHATRVDEVMSRNPVTVYENDDTSSARRLMSEHQIRRIPVVDQNNRLLGIIAVADLARHEDEEEVGEMVEDISQPYGVGSWTSSSGQSERQRFSESEHMSTQSIAGPMAFGALCLGIGAGVMYLLDPNRGRTRRAIARDKAKSLYSASGEAVSRTTEDIRNRAAGLVASSKSWLRHEQVPDDKLIARIRSRMGRYVSHPHAIQVEANNGHLVLSGSILGHEVARLLKCVQGTPGVQSVENRLDVQETAASNPNLQGGQTRTGERSEFMQKNWSPSARMMAGAVGGGMMLYGLKSHSKLGKATASVGLGLLTRGITNREMSAMKRWM